MVISQLATQRRPHKGRLFCCAEVTYGNQLKTSRFYAACFAGIAGKKQGTETNGTYYGSKAENLPVRRYAGGGGGTNETVSSPFKISML
ncbi:MAG: hypothetical protein IPO41_10575 [Acidobacteria bacterium]|nr:hypothetical protein [Acidobacteriota bacterium]